MAASVTWTLNSSVSSEPKELVEFDASIQLSIKLNSTNYPAWYKQLHSLLVARDLVGYVTGETPCPSPTNGTGASATPNPAYNLWICQDKLLYIALLGSCDPEARSVMSFADTSRDAWIALQRAFSNKSRSRIMSLKERLSSITKGTTSVSSYLQAIRSIADELALIGHPLDDLDLVIYALNGLGPSFREFTASVRTRDSPILFNDLYDKLVDFEMFLQREDRFSAAVPVTANHVQRRYNGNSKGRNSVSPFSDSGARKSASPDFGNSSQKNYSNSDIVCQFCDKSSNIARNCYKIKGYPKRRNHTAHVAQVTPPSNSGPPEWLFDSGASHHITNDLNTLSIKGEYNGTDSLQVANGEGSMYGGDTSARVE